MNPTGQRPSVGQRLVAAAFVAASDACSALPRAFTLPAARAAGHAACWLLPRRRRVALDNVRCALGAELSPAAQRRLARMSFGHAGAMAMDLLTLPRVAADPAAHCEASAASLDLLREARSRGRGVLLAAGHFGLFESMGILLGHEGLPVTFVAKAFENPALDAEINRRRGATGNRVLHKGGAKGRIRELLAAGEMVAIVVDQHVSLHDRSWVRFVGLPAATSRTIGTLAVESGAPVVPIHSHPIDGWRCRCEFGPILEAPRTGDPDADGAALVTTVIAEMERALRRQPEAWLWLHRRWKVCPDELRGRYPSYTITESEDRRRFEAYVRAKGGNRS